MKKFSIIALLALILCFTSCLSTPVKASNLKVQNSKKISTYGSLSGYTQFQITGYYQPATIQVNGSYSFGCGMTIKCTCADSNAQGYITIKKPNGSSLKNSANIKSNTETFYQLYNVYPGEYTIEASGWYETSPVTIEIWIYA